MIINLKIVTVDSKYCDYLRKYDNRVPYNKGDNETRPFVGVLFEINNCEYFAPLSSPKDKNKKMKNTIDFYKIDEGNLGAINFNNMIPVKEQNYYLVNLKKKNNKIEEIKYKTMLNKQLQWLNERYDEVKNKSKKLYDLYNSGKLSNNIMDRCCNFKLLEEKCSEYNSDK